MTGARVWFTTAAASDYSGSHPVTIRKAAEAGELHGTQRKTKGRWRFHVDCLDAWISGGLCEHQGRRSA